jgi:RNA-directed DNA polymerase
LTRAGRVGGCPSTIQAASASPIVGEIERPATLQPLAKGRWLAQVVRGYFAYHAVPTNSAAIGAFRHHDVVDLWRCSLSRRSQRSGITWQRIKQIADDWLPQPKILHPWPQQRFAVRYSR